MKGKYRFYQKRDEKMKSKGQTCAEKNALTGGTSGHKSI